MSDVRILCPPPRRDRGAVLYPTASDVHVYAIASDGSEIEITDGIASITWTVSAGKGARAVIEFCNVDVDVGAVLETAASESAPPESEPESA